ncbi:WG repeat-containing protein [Negadavirga shengliensis]|uniref:WG repeat-containing protein n=1 Tax=Negadavirga shengliensis TaxID=1389218 RepID=A0ABV9T4M1_9BACT
MSLNFTLKNLTFLFILGMVSPSVHAQTWEIFDRDYRLIRKIENGNLNILGSALRVNAVGDDLNLLSQEYESFATIDNSSIYQYLEPWVIVKNGGKLGAFHEYGDEVLKPEYDRIENYYNLLLSQKDNQFFVYDRGTKKTVRLGAFESARFAKNGQVIAKTPQGYFLPLSEEPNRLYEHLEDPSVEFIIAREPSGFGLINRDGEYILDPIIEEIQHLEGNHFFAHNGNEYMLIKAQTNKADIRYTSYHRIAIENDVMLEYIHGKLRRIMKNDGILLDITGMTSVKRTGRNHYNVHFRDGKTGLLNQNGRWEVPPTLTASNLSPGSEGLFGARIGEQYGFINAAGEVKIPSRFDEVRRFSEGLAGVKMGITWGYVDKDDRIVIPYYFDEVGEFFRGFSVVKKNGKYNLINKEGKEVLENYYDKICLTDENYYLTEEMGLYGLVNPMGEEISTPKFDEIRRENYDRILIRIGDRYGIMKENGDYSLPLFYSQILFDSETEKILAKSDEIIIEEPEEEDNRKKRNKKGA